MVDNIVTFDKFRFFCEMEKKGFVEKHVYIPQSKIWKKYNFGIGTETQVSC